MPNAHSMPSTLIRRLTMLALAILNFFASLSLALPHNLRPGPVCPPPGLPEATPATHNPSDLNPPVWISKGWRTKNLEQHLDAPPDYSSFKYPVFSLNSDDLHHSITGFSSKHSCMTKTQKLFHINGVPRAIRGDDFDALYPKGFASWVGQDPYKQGDWKAPQHLPKNANDRPAPYSNNTSSLPPDQQPKVGIPGHTLSALPQNLGFTSSCISVSTNGAPLRSLILSTARPYVDPATFSRLHPEYIPPHYDPGKPYAHLLPYDAKNLPPNAVHIPPTQAMLWMTEGCRGPPDHWSRTPNPSGVDGASVGKVPKWKKGWKGGPNGWAEHCVVMPEQDMGLREGALGKLGRNAGWRSMRVWYGSEIVPESMFGGGGQTLATQDATVEGTEEKSKDDEGINVGDKLKEQTKKKLPTASGKKWWDKKKGGK